MSKLLSKDGKLMSEGGKLVFTNDPASCLCCQDSTSVDECLPGCIATNGVFGYGQGECDGLEADVFPNIISMAPDPGCDQITINFTIENQDGSPWVGESTNGFGIGYVYLAVRALGQTSNNCVAFTYNTATPAPDVTRGDGSTIPGGGTHADSIYEFEWDISLADGATTDFSITLDLNQCDCDAADVIQFHVGVDRGCQGFIQAECCPTGSV